MIVSVDSRMVSAISLGVFCRRAPSTNAIIRSTKDSPGLVLIFTTIRSDSTVVPPVTEEKSPPDSRITGARSAVLAASSTQAMPSTTSPSPGITCPASTTHRSPTWSSLEALSTIVSSGSWTWATVSDRVLRRVSAWALPRPSATASAKLANSTVNQSQIVTSAAKPSVSRMARIVVRTLPTSTTNMTGLRAIWRGSSFTKLSGMARARIARSNIDAERRWCVAPPPIGGGVSGEETTGVELSGDMRPLLELADQVLDDGAERDDREVGEADDDEHHRREQAGEQGRPGRERARRRGDGLLAAERARDREGGAHQEEATDQHRDALGGVVPVGVAGESAESRPVVVCWRDEAVDDLAQPVWSGIGDRAQRGLQDHGDAGEGQDNERDEQDVEHDQLHLRGLDLLAEVLRRSPHHQPGDEHAQQREHEHPVQACARATRAHLAQHHVDQRDRAPDRGEAVVGGDHGAVGGAGGGRGVETRCLRPEAHLLALHVAAGLGRGDRLVGAPRGELRVSGRLERHRDQCRCQPEHEHSGADHVALLEVLVEDAVLHAQRVRVCQATHKVQIL